MTATRAFFISLVLTTVFLLFIDRPIHPSPTPLLNKSLSQVPRVPQRQSVHGYERSEFGDWAPALIDGHSCTTRHLILSQTYDSPVTDSCKISRSPVTDPYTLAPLTEEVQIDHVFPLRAAWDLGAHSWPAEKRKRFANDPLNLVAVSAAANQQKSDMLPSQWQPSLKSRCWYARRLALIAATYELPLPKDDIATMRMACYRELLS